MTTSSRVPRPLPDGANNDTVVSLEQENTQLRHAIGSHAAVDQALGVLIAVHKIPPGVGFEVLREVSQHTNIKLHAVAKALIDWALGQPLPEPVEEKLGEAVQRHYRTGNDPDQPH
jgi:hypothetical protein